MHFSNLAAVAAVNYPNISNEHGDLNWRDIATIFRVFTIQHAVAFKNPNDGQMNAVSSLPVTI